MPDLAALAGIARSLLPAEVAVAASDPRRMHPLWPGEGISGVAARQAEFSAGRAAARAALATLAHPACAVPANTDRAPQWPVGIIGSITHSATACLAAVARAGSLRGIGLDLEPDEPLPEGLEAEILLPGERAWLATRSMAERGFLARLLFSAKEAAYKAQYPASGALFGFDAMQIDLASETGHFTAVLGVPADPYPVGMTMAGRFARCEGHILTAVIL